MGNHVRFIPFLIHSWLEEGSNTMNDLKIELDIEADK
jgi:hypothetical protein